MIVQKLVYFVGTYLFGYEILIVLADGDIYIV